MTTHDKELGDALRLYTGQLAKLDPVPPNDPYRAGYAAGRQDGYGAGYDQGRRDYMNRTITTKEGTNHDH